MAAAAALLYPLGLNDADEVEDALMHTVSPFHAWSSTYARKPIALFGPTFYLDLNCAGSNQCGSGILDLSKAQAPISGATIAGTPAIGEPLTALPGTWTGSPKFVYLWERSDGAAVSNAATYYPTVEDVGSTFTVTVRPESMPFRPLGSTSPATTVVLAGPNVTMTAPPTTMKYGVNWTTTVTVAGDEVADGVVELRRGSTVLASGTTVGGTVDLSIGGTRWAIGSNRIRAAYVGAGTTNAASSIGHSTTITKASSAISTALPTSVKRTRNAQLSVRVTATGVSAPTGTIRVYDGAKRIMTFSLTSAHKGKRTVLLPKITKAGTHRIKAVYSGSSYVFGRTSLWRSIKVT